MFGKRASQGGSPPKSEPVSSPVAASAKADPRLDAVPAGAVGSAPAERRSDSYYQTKSMIFGALIEEIGRAHV